MFLKKQFLSLPIVFMLAFTVNIYGSNSSVKQLIQQKENAQEQQEKLPGQSKEGQEEVVTDTNDQDFDPREALYLDKLYTLLESSQAFAIGLQEVIDTRTQHNIDSEETIARLRAVHDNIDRLKKTIKKKEEEQKKKEENLRQYKAAFSLTIKMLETEINNNNDDDDDDTIERKNALQKDLTSVNYFLNNVNNEIDTLKETKSRNNQEERAQEDVVTDTNDQAFDQEETYSLEKLHKYRNAFLATITMVEPHVTSTTDNIMSLGNTFWALNYCLRNLNKKIITLEEEKIARLEEEKNAEMQAFIDNYNIRFKEKLKEYRAKEQILPRFLDFLKQSCTIKTCEGPHEYIICANALLNIFLGAACVGVSRFLFHDTFKNFSTPVNCILAASVAGINYINLSESFEGLLFGSCIDNNLTDDTSNLRAHYIMKTPLSLIKKALPYLFLTTCSSLFISQDLKKTALSLALALPIYIPQCDYFQETLKNMQRNENTYNALHNSYLVKPATTNFLPNLLITSIQIGLLYGARSIHKHTYTQSVFLCAAGLSLAKSYYQAKNNFYIRGIHSGIQEVLTDGNITTRPKKLSEETDSELKDESDASLKKIYRWIDTHKCTIGIGAITTAYLGFWYKNKQGVLPFDDYAGKAFTKVATEYVEPAIRQASTLFGKKVTEVATDTALETVLK